MITDNVCFLGTFIHGLKESFYSWVREKKQQNNQSGISHGISLLVWNFSAAWPSARVVRAELEIYWSWVQLPVWPLVGGVVFIVPKWIPQPWLYIANCPAHASLGVLTLVKSNYIFRLKVYIKRKLWRRQLRHSKACGFIYIILAGERVGIGPCFIRAATCIVISSVWVSLR